MLHLHRKSRRKVSSQLILVSTFIGIALAAIDTVWAIYMYGLGLSESTIGFISAGLVAIAVIVSLTSTPILEKINQNKILLTSIGLSIIGYVIITIYPILPVFLVVAALLTIFAVYRVECFEIIFRDNTLNSQLNKEVGLLYTTLNIGWLVGPLIAGYIMIKFGLSSVFLASAAFMFIAFSSLYSLHLKPITKKRNNIDGNVFKNMISFLKDKKVHLPYIMSSGIEVWWSIIYIYMPIFMIKNGLSEGLIGLFMALIVVPLILVEYVVGKKSEKKGFKFFFSAGYFTLAIVSVILFILGDKIMLQLGLVIIASFFVGFLEPLQDTFFFKNVKKEDEEKFYPIYGTAADVGGLIGKVAIATTLLILPDKFSYIIMAALMLIFGLASRKIKK